jgi:hypothetical protein
MILAAAFPIEGREIAETIGLVRGPSDTSVCYLACRSLPVRLA